MKGSGDASERQCRFLTELSSWSAETVRMMFCGGSAGASRMHSTSDGHLRAEGGESKAGYSRGSLKLEQSFCETTPVV